MKRTASREKSNLLRIGMSLASIAAIIFGTVGVLKIYQHSKTDGHGNGRIVVKTCKETNWEWRTYTCVGTYHSGAGMVELQNATVRTWPRERFAGDSIEDVYPKHAGQAEQDGAEFVTGQERSSVLFNLGWLAAVGLSIMLPIITAVLFLSDRRSKTYEHAA